MTITQAIIQSVVEGLTEFLPISSTAHMKFVNPILGVDPNDDFSKLFDIVIQLPAILAVVALYWRKFFDFSRLSFYIKLVVAVIPVRLHLDYRAHPGVVAALKTVIADGKPRHLSAASRSDVWRIRSLALGRNDESPV